MVRKELLGTVRLHYELKCYCSVTLLRENIFIVCTLTLAIACKFFDCVISAHTSVIRALYVFKDTHLSQYSAIGQIIS